MFASVNYNKIEIYLKKTDLDTEKLNFEGQKLQQKDEMDKERLQSQEDQAELRRVTLAGQRRQNNGKKVK